MPPHQALQAALQNHRAGRLREAEAQYRRILATSPKNDVALHMLGVVHSQTGRHAEAAELIRRAIAINSAVPEYHCNLALSQLNLELPQEAIVSSRRALALKPDYPNAFNNLGRALLSQGQIDEAASTLSRAIALRPEFPEAHCNLGIVLARLGRYDDAIAAYRRAIAQRPSYVNAHYNLGNALRERGLLEESLNSFQQAITLDPANAAALNNLGVSLFRMHRNEQAVAVLRQALAINPRLFEALANLGGALRDLQQTDAAVEACAKAAEFGPAYMPALVNLSAAFKDQGRLDESLAALDRALAVDPTDAGTHSNRVYTMLYHPAFDAAAILAAHRQWNDRHAKPLAPHIRPHDNDRAPDRRLRVGYVSPDFRNHCQALFTVPLLSQHDKEQVEVFCYSDVASPDDLTARLRTHADHWRPILGMRDEQVAGAIRADRIDVLVDLTVHMADNRLPMFARKPAPVQVTWLGYPGTTGMDAMDYRLTDPHLDPPDQHDAFYSERSIRLPETFWCYDPLTADPSPGDLPATKTGVVTFGCLNNFCKVNDVVLALWAAVLRAVPHSQLLLRVPANSSRQRITTTLQSQGIDADRIRFADHKPRLQYLASYQQIDIGLDTVPYNGHTTSLDSFWMGVPVVTLIGPTVVGRAGLCQLSNLGMTDLAATSADQFVTIATALADDLPRLQEMRRTLRDRLAESPLMNAPRFARAIEAAYRQMWRAWTTSH